MHDGHYQTHILLWIFLWECLDKRNLGSYFIIHAINTPNSHDSNEGNYVWIGTLDQELCSSYGGLLDLEGSLDQEVTIFSLLMNRSGSCLVSLERCFQGLSNGRHGIARRLDSMENVLFLFCATHFKYTVLLTNACTSPFV